MREYPLRTMRPDDRRPRRGLRIASALLLGLVASGTSLRPAGASDAEEERLRALGYVDTTGERRSPHESSVPIRDPDRIAPGYTLYASCASCRADLIDSTGRSIRSWAGTGCRRWSRAKLLSDGDLLVVEMADAKPEVGNAGHLLRMSWDGRLRWKRAIQAHHDVTEAPDGTIVALVRRRERVPEVSPDRDLLVESIAILDPDGAVLREHGLYDMLRASTDVFPLERALGRARSAGAGTAKPIDLTHANAVAVISGGPDEPRHPAFRAGRVLVTMRKLHSVGVFDLEAGRLLWAWGADELEGPHEASFLANGHVLIFDNGTRRKWSRVVEVDPGTGAIVWEYRDAIPGALYTQARGSAQRLANGNTIVESSNQGYALEVTREGDTVWKFRNPHTGRERRRSAICRMKRYPAEWIDRLERRVSEPVDPPPVRPRAPGSAP